MHLVLSAFTSSPISLLATTKTLRFTLCFYVLYMPLTVRAIGSLNSSKLLVFVMETQYTSFEAGTVLLYIMHLTFPFHFSTLELTSSPALSERRIGLWLRTARYLIFSPPFCCSECSVPHYHHLHLVVYDRTFMIQRVEYDVSLWSAMHAESRLSSEQVSPQVM